MDNWTFVKILLSKGFWVHIEGYELEQDGKIRIINRYNSGNFYIGGSSNVEKKLSRKKKSKEN